MLWIIGVPFHFGRKTKNGGWHKLRGRNRTGRIEVIDQAILVNRHRKSLTHAFVVEGRVGVVHTDVENVGAAARLQLEICVTGDHFEIIGTGIVDAVHGAGL